MKKYIKPRVIETARQWHSIGGNPRPPSEDGSKSPDGGSWKMHQKKRFALEDIDTVFQDRYGVGVFMGRIFKPDNSGYETYGIECLEFDSSQAWEDFKNAVKAAGLQALLDRVSSGYLENTPSGGVHLFYFCEAVQGNLKLAQAPTGETDNSGKSKLKTLSETRGYGGWVVVAPSSGPVHPSGKAYELVQGGPETIVQITPSERQALHDVAGSLDRMPQNQKAAGQGSGSQQSTGRAKRSVQKSFNERASWDAILVGWERIGNSDNWRRPGAETTGKDATTNADGLNRLWVHSTSTPFDTGRYYTPFQAYALLNHNGDHSAAEAEILAHWDEWMDTSESPAPTDQKARYTFLNIDEYRKRPTPEYLIEGLILKGSQAVWWGDTGSYKSFLALDAELSIAAGIDWQGFKTLQGPTAHIIGEGGGLFLKRVDAWLKHHGIETVPDFYMLPASPKLNADVDLKGLVAAIKALPVMPALVVVDTLSRTFKGNENGQEDMQRYRDAAAAIQELGPAVLVIHHSGKNGQIRGNSVLPDDADSIIRFERTRSGAKLTVEKTKDADILKPIHLKRNIIVLSEAPSDPDVIDMKPETSLVFTLDQSANAQMDDLTPIQVQALQVLFDSGDGGLTHSAWMQAAGLESKTRTFADALKCLKDRDFVTQTNPRMKGNTYRVSQSGRDFLASTGERDGDES